jgi:hypothetical protein
LYFIRRAMAEHEENMASHPEETVANLRANIPSFLEMLSGGDLSDSDSNSDPQETPEHWQSFSSQLFALLSGTAVSDVATEARFSGESDSE